MDMQGFKKPGNDFVLKELAFELCYNGLSWNSGDWNYSEIGNLLQDAFKDAKRFS